MFVLAETCRSSYVTSWRQSAHHPTLRHGGDVCCYMTYITVRYVLSLRRHMDHFTLCQGRHVCIIICDVMYSHVNHHALCDGWSMDNPTFSSRGNLLRCAVDVRFVSFYII